MVNTQCCYNYNIYEKAVSRIFFMKMGYEPKDKINLNQFLAKKTFNSFIFNIIIKKKLQ